MKWTIGPYTFGGAADEPDPGPKNDVWKKTNVIVEEPIPGQGNRTITVRTSDKTHGFAVNGGLSASSGTLWHCTLTIRSVTDKRYQQLKLLVDDGGPFMVNCHHGMHRMYIVDGEPTHDENDKEAPIKEKGQEVNEATWVLTLLEAND